MNDDQTTGIRLLICDDQVIVCEGLRAMLDGIPDITIVGVAHNGAAALELARATHPDLVLMDLKMPQMNGIQATSALGEHCPGVRVLVLTTYDDDASIMAAIRAGAAGYVLKGTTQEDLVRAIRETVQGGSPLDPGVAGKLLKHVASQPERAAGDQSLISHLSERERAVLRLLGQGMSNTEIAQTLILSEGSVKNYVSVIFSKLGVGDRTQAAILAIRAGLAPL
jgi:two-component system, NarL family, response regulator LiaR